MSGKDTAVTIVDMDETVVHHQPVTIHDHPSTSTIVIDEHAPLVDEDGNPVIFNEPIDMKFFSECSLEGVVQRKLTQHNIELSYVPADSSSSKSTAGRNQNNRASKLAVAKQLKIEKVDYKQQQQDLLKNLNKLLKYEEDEEELMRIETLKKQELEQRLAESVARMDLSVTKKKHGGYEDEEDEEDEDDIVTSAPVVEPEEDEEDEEDDDLNYRKPKVYKPPAVQKSAPQPAVTPTKTSPTADNTIGDKRKEVSSHGVTKVNWCDTAKLSNKEYEELRPRMAQKYPFELDDFQKQAVMRLERREHVFVAAHTSAGKTVVAEYGIALALKNNSRAVYTSPIKALSNQKYRDFKEKYGADNVGIVTGDVSVNPQAQCLIMTTEIFRSMLYKGSDTVRNIEFVIFDEVHYVNDSERGVVWEEVIIMLPESITLIFLSATTPNAPEFSEWIGRTKRKKVYLTSTDKRPVPLRHFLYHDGEMYNVMEGDKGYHPEALAKAKKRIEDKAKPKQQTPENARMAAQRQGEKAAKAAQLAGKNVNQQKQIAAQVVQKELSKKATNVVSNKVGATGPVGGGKADWTALINVLAAGGRAEAGGLGEINFGDDVVTAKNVRLNPKARAEQEEVVKYEKLPQAMRDKITKKDYEQQCKDIRGDEDDPEGEIGLLPVVVFSFSKRKCEELSDFLKGKNFLGNREKGKVAMILNEVISRLNPIDADLPQILRMKDMLTRGIGVHHSGLLPILKETVEILFSQSIVKVLFATETFAMGVNMPARAVIFNGYRKHDGKNFRDLLPGEYIQMAGRAGRRGLDKVGTVIITSWQDLPPAEVDMKRLLVGKPLILSSQFRLRYNMILNLVRVNNLSVQDMIKASFTEFASQKMLSNHDLSVKLRRYEDYLLYLEDSLQHSLSSFPTNEEGYKLKDLIENYQELSDTCQELLRRQYEFLCKNVDQLSFSTSAGSSKKVSQAAAKVNPPSRDEWVTRVFAAGRVVHAYVPVLGYSALAMVLLDPVKTKGLSDESLKAAKTAAPARSNLLSASDKFKVGPSRAELLGIGTASVVAETKAEARLSLPTEENEVWIVVAVSPEELTAKYQSSLQDQSRERADEFDSLELRQSLAGLVSKVKELHGITTMGMHFTLTKVPLKFISFIADHKLDIPAPISGDSEASGSTSRVDFNQLLQELFVLKLEAESTVLPPLDIFSEFKLHKHFDFADLHSKTISAMMTCATGDKKDSTIFTENKLMKFLSTMTTSVQLPSLATNLYQSLYHYRKISKKIALIRHVLSDESMSLFPDFQRRVSLLGQLGYLDSACQVITNKGRVACELNTCDELLGTEILFNNILEPLSAEEAVAMLSALVFQEKNDVDDVLTVNMETAKCEMQLIHLNLTTVQDLEKIENDPDAKPILNFGLCQVVYEWAKGTPFKEITKFTEFQEGSIVRAITRLDELCRDVMKAAVVMGNPGLYRKMEAASKLIKRDIVFAASLYIQ